MYPEGEKLLEHKKIEIKQLSERKISESTNCVERKSTNNTTYDEYSKQSEADLEQLKNIKTQQNNCAADYSQKQDHFDNELIEMVTNVSQKQNELMEMITNVSECANEMKPLILNKLENENTLY